jgi:hypothetical protein
MKGTEVFNVLKAIGAAHLHHANTGRTSCTFLERGGLLSRAFVEENKLEQTPQPASDEIDKKYGIWNRIFVDHVDIHYRAGRKKGPNHYGPVLFRFDIALLLELPAGTDVHATKSNPVHWHDEQQEGERWFMTERELGENIHFGDFDKMLVINTPSGKLAFPKKQVEIFLDDPNRSLPSGQDAYAYATTRLQAAANTGKIKVLINPHECRTDCSCVQKYATFDAERLGLWFT